MMCFVYECACGLQSCVCVWVCVVCACATRAHVVICSRRQKNVTEALAYLRDKGVECEGVAAHVAKAEDRKKLFDLACSKKGCKTVACLCAHVCVREGGG
jgi:hypothetical protein